ncbi:MAG: PAS domain S-box protein [Rhodothermales bacterium]
MRILILKGKDTEELLIEGILHARNHEIHRCVEVEEAAVVFEREQPHLVILARMGEESLALCRRIRETVQGERPVVLAVVPSEDEEYLKEVVEAGIDDCILEAISPAYGKARLDLFEQRARKRAWRYRIKAELDARVRQQAVVAEIGQRVLAGAPLQNLMDYAVEATASALDVEFCKVLERLPGEDGLLLRAGVGWKEGLVGQAVIEAGANSQPWYTLRSEAPVVIEDFRAETRFNMPPLLKEHDVISGVGVVIQGHEAPYGLLGAHTARPHTFHEDDINFLQAVANVLAAAIERYSSEEKLLRERNFVSAILDTAGALVVVLDAEGDIVRFNRACEEMTGYAFEEVADKKIWDLFLVPEEIDEVRAVIERLHGGELRNEYEGCWVTKQGECRVIAWSNTVLFNDAGLVEYIIATGIDITERKQAEQALQESEARSRAILETTVDGIITIDERGIVEAFNSAAEKVFGYTADEVIGQNVTMLMPVPYREEHDSYIQNYLETGHRKVIGIGREEVGQRKDGTIFPLDLAVSEIKLGDRRLFTGIARDISERRSLEQEILRISEQERRRIGHDLHDGLGQMLTGIGLISQSLSRSLQTKGQGVAEEVAEITELIREADQHARGLARGLVPVDLEAKGLATALHRLSVNAERLFGVRCTFEEVGSVLIHDNTIATHLFRIAQEAVSNAVKHGRAKHVKLSLASGHGQVRLRIQDDGVGFPAELDEERGGMGVRIMHYRARVIGATLEIAGGVDGGTTITCTLRRLSTPFHQAEATAV